MAEPQTRLISCYRRAAHYFDQEGVRHAGSRLQTAEIKLGVVLDSMRTAGGTAAKIGVLRDMIDAEASIADQRAYKRTQLEAITPSTHFGWKRPRTELNGWKHSGAVVVDFDHIGDIAETKARLAAVSTGRKPHAVSVFTSPSGDGAKAIIHVSPLPQTQHEHAQAWARCCALYEPVVGVKADPTGSDASRLCFLSYDPDMILRPAGETHAFLWKQS